MRVHGIDKEEKMDLTFKTTQGRFNFRVGAIIIHNDQVLMVKGGVYYYSIGGRVKYHETFFNEVTLKEHFHEVCLYYLMKVENTEKFNRYNENKKEEFV